MSPAEAETAHRTETLQQAADRHLDTAEKLGFMLAKLEEVHSDLKEHVALERSALVTLEARIEALELSVASWRRTWTAVKVSCVVLAGMLVYEYKQAFENLKRLFGQP
jgi:uncharacterized coiled-coil protein SlyX